MPEQAGKEGLLLLMADGNLKDHEVVKSAARACNFNHVFTSVYNGAQLMDYLNKRGAYYSSREVQPDVLIMDIVLDRIDGWEVLQMIRDDKELRKIPVYVLTKNRREEEATRAMGLGVKGYFEKPLTPEEWNKIVHTICSTDLADNPGRK